MPLPPFSGTGELPSELAILRYHLYFFFKLVCLLVGSSFRFLAALRARRAALRAHLREVYTP